MITKVRLKNWKSHLDSEFNFTRGTNALIGILGSGKSSVLEAICFALFGSFPKLQSKKVKLDEVIMNKPVEKNRAVVSVSFEMNGEEYSVMRIIERNKGTTYSEIRCGEKVIEAPNTQRVTEAVEKILKVNYELFSKVIYSEQNALDYFLTIPRGNRLKKIDELLMIDKFERARGNCVSLRNKLIDRKLGKQSIVDQTDVTTLKKTIEELTESLDKLEKDRASLEKKLIATREKRKLEEQEVKKLEEMKQSIEEYRKEERGIISAINEINESIKNLKKVISEEKPSEIKTKLSQLSQSIKKLEDTFKSKRERQIELNKEISEYKTELKILQDKILKELEGKFEEKKKLLEELDEIKQKYGENIESNLREKREEFEKMKEKIQKTIERIDQLDHIISELSKAESKCPICETRLTERRRQKLIEEKYREIKKLKGEVEKLKLKKEADEEELKKLEEILDIYNKILDKTKDVDEIKNKIEKTREEVEKLSNLSKRLEEELKEFKGEVEKLEKELKEKSETKQMLEMIVSRIEEYKRSKKRLEDLNEERKKIEEKLRTMEKSLEGKDLEKCRKELTELVGMEKEIESRIEGIKQLLEEKNQRLKEEKQKLGSIEKQKEEIAKLEKIIRNLQIFEKALEETQNQLRKEFVEAVNYTMNQLWSTLYPYGDFTNIALNVENGDYVLQLKDRMNRWVNVEGIASGGERSIACLSLRVAFALVLAPHLKLLILDEPTPNLDSRAIRVLANVLREKINEFIEQTFLITHQKELEDAVSGAYYILERDKEKGETTKVSLGY